MLTCNKQAGCQVQVVEIEHNHEHQRLHAEHQIVGQGNTCAPPEREGRQEQECP